MFWIDASNVARFEQSCRDIADKVKIPGRQNAEPDIVKLVKSWLHDEGNGKWVLILDNVDDDQFPYGIPHVDLDSSRSDPSCPPERPIWSYFSKGLKGNIIITSRSQWTVSWMVDDGNIIEIGPMEAAEWREAEEILVRVMETKKQMLGPEHPDTLASMNNLASTYFGQGQLEEAEEILVQTTEALKCVLGPEHPSTLAAVDQLASTYLGQGRLKEAEELLVKVMEARKQVAVLKHADTLESSSGTVAHNREPSPDLVDSEDSDSSIGNDTVFSAHISIPSTRSLESGRGEINALLTQELATLLYEDGILLSFLLVGVSNEQIGFERMRNNFRRLLKNFAENLEADIASEIHRDLRSFIASSSTMITRELFAMTPIDEKRNVKSSVPEAERRMALVAKRPVHERKVEGYLQGLHRSRPALPKIEEIEKSNLDEESDEDSIAEEASEDEPYEGSLQHLDQLRNFILESTAYQTLRCRLEDFVQPSLYSRLRDLVTMWSIPGHKNHGHIAQYELRNLVAELRHVDPHKIQFDNGQ